MNKRTSLLLATLMAMNLSTAHGLELYNDGDSALDFKGNLSVYYIQNGEESEINDGFSRYIFDMSHQLKDDWQAVALLEWGIKISRTDNQLFINNSGLTSTGPTSETTWLRLGYVGAGHEKYGQLTMGKQWGVSYDVGGVTDWFEVFGASAQGTYNFGTDGGFSGTGRAEQSIKYNVNYEKFSFGAQYLVSDDVLRTSDKPDEKFGVKFNDSFGLSVIYQAPFELGFGLAYNKAKVSVIADVDKFSTFVQSPKIDDELITGHITYRPYGSLGLHVALVVTDMTNHDINDVGKVMNKATGVELFSAYRFENDISLILGYNSLKDNSAELLARDNSYHLKYYILSARYHWDEDFYLYIESKLDHSTLVNSEGVSGENATGIGMMFVF